MTLRSDLLKGVLRAENLWYLEKDHIGSVVGIIDSRGALVETSWYDPWGRRKNSPKYEPDTPLLGERLGDTLTRGFTGQEHLSKFELIHMNGRIYDPRLASFVSPDLVTRGFPTQALDRYAYTSNNPLRWTDPSGYDFFGDVWHAATKPFVDVYHGAEHALNEAGKWLEQNWRTVVIVAVAIAVSTVSFGTLSPLAAAIASGMLVGAATGATAAILYGGSVEDVISGAVTGAVIGGFSAGAFYGVGSAFSGQAGSLGASNSVGAFAGHGLVGGLRESAQGGNFWSGFASGALTKITSAYGPVFDDTTANVARAAIVGGAVASVSGGNFANGAATGAFSYLFNDLFHQEAKPVVKQRLTFRDALNQWATGNGEDVEVPLSSLNLSGVSASETFGGIVGRTVSGNS